MADESSLRNTKMFRKRVPEVSSNNITNVWDEIKVAEERKVESAKKLLQNYLLSSWPAFLEKIT